MQTPEPSDNVQRGRCLCGDVTWQYTGKPTWACFCHCDDCRRNCAAPVVAFIGVKLADFAWTGQQPAFYPSSPGVKRHFCSKCGSPMAFQAEHYEGEIHVYAASLENPTTFEPAFHVYTDEQLPWLNLHDKLPRYAGSGDSAPVTDNN